MISAISRRGPLLPLMEIKPVRTIIPPAEVNAAHIPAKLEIRNLPAEIRSDLQPIWDEFGLKRPSAFLQEIRQNILSEFAEDLVTNVRQGDETADLRRKNSPNIFGRHAYEDYMRKNRVEVVIDVAPKQRVKFDVKVHPPEIKVETRPIGFKAKS